MAVLGLLCLHQSDAESSTTTISRFFEKTDAFLRTFVVDGSVNYQGIKDEPGELQELVSVLANANPALLSSMNAAKAFWINAYNISTINTVVTSYPLRSPQDESRFFESRDNVIAGETLSLNEIEKDRLLNNYPDPRVHFAIVCAAVGCPPLVSQAYTAEQLDVRLDERAKAVINDPRWVRVDHGARVVHASRLFDWYSHEFEEESGTIIAFLNSFHDEGIPVDYSIEFMPYDWSLNDIGPGQAGELTTADVDLQAYTPGKLLLPGQIEVKEFWNLYTQTAYFDDNGERRDSDGRSTYFTATTSILYGIARRWNVGLDIYLKAVQNANDPDSSPFEVLTFPSDDNARATFTAIAPKVKVSPFEWAPQFSLQTAVVIPLANDLEDDPFLDYDGVQWWTQLFYDYSMGEDFLLYLESDYYWRLDSDAESFVTPLKAILQHYPGNRWTIYALGELAPSWANGKRNAYYTQIGLGTKYQLLTYLEVEFLASIFPVGESKGAGSTLNLGIRLLK